MSLLAWIRQHVSPEERDTARLFFEHMESQSDRRLPIIYTAFDPANPGHWADRGAALDYVLSTDAEGGRVLDFGPGDGWPSLVIAPRVGEVVGVDGAPKRVAVCRKNAARLGIHNAKFTLVPPGSALPFPDASFDAVVAASPVEQTPNPTATLRELYRVLKAEGRLRIHYESLTEYRDEPEVEARVWPIDDDTTRLMLYNRHIDEEYAVQYALTYALPQTALSTALGDEQGRVTAATATAEALATLEPHRIDAAKATTRHPSGPTLVRWLEDVGFSSVASTHNGLRTAAQLCLALDSGDRPSSLEAIDAYLRPIVEVAISLEAPVDSDPMLTAIK